MNIVLIGYRGSGKTSVGRAVAARLGFSFVDTDTLIEQRAGCTIAEIFARETEAGFRRRETEVVVEVAAGDNTVISAGGGAVLADENVRALEAGGWLVWLRAPADVLWQRITQDTATTANRPNLTASGGLDEVRSLLAVREPTYRAAATATIDVTDKSIDEVADEVVQQFRKMGGP